MYFSFNMNMKYMWKGFFSLFINRVTLFITEYVPIKMNQLVLQRCLSILILPIFFSPRMREVNKLSVYRMRILYSLLSFISLITFHVYLNQPRST